MGVPRSLLSAPLQDLDLTLVSGEWPQDLSGEFVVSSPQSDPRLSSALFGSGALARISLTPGTYGAPPDRWALRTNVIDSPSRRLIEAAPHAFESQPYGYSSPLGSLNQANTAPLPWGDRLFATWDVGRPVEVDPHTLQFIGEVGHRDSWGESTFPLPGEILPFYFSSAHPIVDGERDCLWTVKQMPVLDGMQLFVIRWDGNGTSFDMWPVTDGIVFGSSHTLTQTRDWLVLADSGNFKTDLGEVLGGQRTATIDEQASVYIINKAALEATVSGTPFVPVKSQIAPTTGHFYAKWEDADGIDVVFEHMDLMDLGQRLQPGDRNAYGEPIREELLGLYNMAMAPSSLSEVRFNPTTGHSTLLGKLREDWTFNLQLSAMDWSTEGLANPTLHHVAYQGWHPEAVSERVLDQYRSLGRVAPLPTEQTPASLASIRRGSAEVAARYEFANLDDHITSPAFAPRDYADTPHTSRYAGSQPGGHDGYVIVPVLNDNGFRVEIFDAASVGAGPVATLATPHGECLPVLLHSAWMPTSAGRSDHERLSFLDELVDAQVDALPTELAATVRTVAHELDETIRAN